MRNLCNYIRIISRETVFRDYLIHIRESFIVYFGVNFVHKVEIVLFFLVIRTMIYTEVFVPIVIIYGISILSVAVYVNVALLDVKASVKIIIRQCKIARIRNYR